MITCTFFGHRDAPWEIKEKVKEAVIELVKSAFSFIAEFSGEIPGSGKEECGNYLEHNLEEAKQEAKIMVDVLADWKVSDLAYKE